GRRAVPRPHQQGRRARESRPRANRAGAPLRAGEGAVHNRERHADALDEDPTPRHPQHLWRGARGALWTKIATRTRAGRLRRSSRIRRRILKRPERLAPAMLNWSVDVEPRPLSAAARCEFLLIISISCLYSTVALLQRVAKKAAIRR